MSCRRAEEIDLMAFAADRTAHEWGAFREHYPTCPECSHAVAKLSRFEAHLRDYASGASGAAESSPAHVSEEDMLSLAEGTLAQVALARVEAHLEGCAACRTEATVLREFEPEPVLQSVREPVTRSALGEAGEGWLDAFRGILAGIFQPGPAFGLALAAALATIFFFLFRDVEGERETPRYAEQAAPRDIREQLPPAQEQLPRAPQGDPRRAPGWVEEPELFAAEDASPAQTLPDEQTLPIERAPKDVARKNAAPNNVAPTQAAPDPRAIERPRSTPEMLAEREVESTSPAPRALPTPEPEGDGEREIVLLAALFPSELPAYRAPSGAGFEGLDPVRIGGTLRSANAPDVHLSVLAPERLGATAQASPRLYWVLDRATPLSVDVVVNDPLADAPLMTKTFAGPFAAGLHFVDLAREGVVLREGVAYDWSVSLVTSGAGHEQDIVSMGGIRRISDPTAPARSSDKDVQAREVHRLAEAGYWYDALDRVMLWSEAMPANERLQAFRESLLKQVGLGAVVRELK